MGDFVNWLKSVNGFDKVVKKVQPSSPGWIPCFKNIPQSKIKFFSLAMWFVQHGYMHVLTGSIQIWNILKKYIQRSLPHRWYPSLSANFWVLKTLLTTVRMLLTPGRIQSTLRYQCMESKTWNVADRNWTHSCNQDLRCRKYWAGSFLSLTKDPIGKLLVTIISEAEI